MLLPMNNFIYNQNYYYDNLNANNFCYNPNFEMQMGYYFANVNRLQTANRKSSRRLVEAKISRSSNKENISYKENKVNDNHTKSHKKETKIRERSRSKGASSIQERNKKHSKIFDANPSKSNQSNETYLNVSNAETRNYLQEFKHRSEKCLNRSGIKEVNEAPMLVKQNNNDKSVDIVELAKKILAEKKKKKEEEAKAKENDVEQPVIIKKVTYLGEIKMDPEEYVQMYGRSLVKSEDLPEYIKKIKTPKGIQLAENYTTHSYETIERKIIAACVRKDYEVRIEEKKNFSAINFNSIRPPAEIIRFEDMNFTKSEFSLILKCLLGNGS